MYNIQFKFYFLDQLEVLQSISLNHIICSISSVDDLQKNTFLKTENG